MSSGLRWTEEQLAEHQRRRASPSFPPMRCADCGGQCERRAANQRYCEPCSSARDVARKDAWSKANPRQPEKVAETVRKVASARAERGREISQEHRVGIAGAYSEPDLAWLVRVAVPFTYAASKNSIYSTRGAGHVVLRRESKQIRSAVALAIGQAVRDQPLRHNKVWIDVFVQKPDHRGDAVNVVDLVCDGIKDAIPVDDRWYSLRRVDWQVVKHEAPMIYIGLGQEACEDAKVCSSCGRVLPFSAFWANKAHRTGRARNCKDCCRSPRRARRAEPDGEARTVLRVEPIRVAVVQASLLEAA